MISGRGFPVAFFNAPVIQIAPATLSPSPSIPQFNSHSLSAMVHGPPMIRDLFVVGLWCENCPSMSMVHMAITNKGVKHEIIPAQKGLIRSGSAKGYCSDSLVSEKR